MRVCAFDIETTDLKALMGRILCASFYAIVDPKITERLTSTWKPKAYTYRLDKKPWKLQDRINDSALCVALRDEIETYNCVVTWNGKMFDIPFLNARLMQAGERPCRPQFHLDLMYRARAGTAGLRIGSSKLVNVQKFFGFDEEKTEISWEQWQRAAAFDTEAMDDVVVHCEKDVEVLGEAYWTLLPLVANLHR
jgi:uncharacterized protein YprB with RNaseH-like and TPR domain